MFKNLNPRNSLEELPGELVEDPVEESVKDKYIYFYLPLRMYL